MSYDPGALELLPGEMVRVPLGPREVLAYVIRSPYAPAEPRSLRAVSAKSAAPRAFDETGLALAQFVARTYLCTLGEALSAVVLAAAVPRTVDRFVAAVARPNPQRYPSVPRVLVDLAFDELAGGFTLEQFLRHPAARRAGDRATLLRRERAFVDPRTHEYRVKVLEPGDAAIAGPKAKALAAYVAAQPGVPRADALLAGFSAAVIARAVQAGAIVEREITPQRSRERVDRPAQFAATAEQSTALGALNAALDGGAFSETLLHGITGSGKTFVYIEAIKHAVRRGGTAIVLVPEISLTPQTARRFELAFGERVAVLHSALSDRERYDAWQACANGEIDVVVGARSAVFAPLRNVRLMVVDEAHEPSYKQETSPRYHAAAVARERMRIAGGVLVLGSATPSLESFAAARSGQTAYLPLRGRATNQALPAVRIVDMAAEFEGGNRRIFSTALADALTARLERGEKSVLFINRRGSAGFVLCRSCGFVPECPRCTVSLTVHRSENLLRCHYCDYQTAAAATCPNCGAGPVREFGAGTQRVAEDVARLYPQARIVRMDSDTTTRVGDHARLLDDFAHSGDVLVGTQMVAKGLDFPDVTLVGVIAADIGLHAPDFRAAERTFDLITQVCGRSGRAKPGEAIVQTYSPQHPAIVFARDHDYDGFARGELEARREAGYPPFAHLAYVGVIGRARRTVAQHADAYASALRGEAEVTVLGPAPYPIARLNGEWRYRIAVRAADPQRLREALRRRVLDGASRERATRVAVNVDP